MSIKTNITWNGKDVKLKAKYVMNKSPFESGLIIQGLAVSACPVDLETLRDSLTVTDKNKTKSVGSVLDVNLIDRPIEDNTAYVGTRVKYASYVEYGTAPHDINSPVKIKGKWVYIGRHPGTKAQPFLRPAFDLAQGEVFNTFKKNGRQEFKEYFKEKS